MTPVSTRPARVWWDHIHRRTLGSQYQVNTGSTCLLCQASNQLFCGLKTDIREGDKAVVMLRSGQSIVLRIGEVHPYSFQYQCRAERDETV